MSEYRIGVVLLLVSAITFSSAGLFTKGVEAGAWEVIFWRGVFAVIFTVGLTIYRGTLKQNFIGIGRSGWAVAVIGALGTAAFIPAFKLTSIANVSLIYAVAPLVAAVLAWVLIAEQITLRTALGCIGALIGVLIIVSGSLGQISVYGDLLALCMTIAMATVMVIYRVFPKTQVAGPSALQSILLFPPCLIIGAPFVVAPFEIFVLAAFGVLFAIASITLAEGAKRVAAAQTALLSALETPLAPVLAFLILMEVPNLATIIGGVIILVVIFATIGEEAATE